MSRDFASLIGGWPRKGNATAIRTFAEDIGVDYQHAATMKQRNSISPDFWPRVLRAAQTVGIALNHERLLRMREARRRKTRPRPSRRAAEARMAS